MTVVNRALLFLVILSLTSCGGGGGGDDPTTPLPTVTNTNSPAYVRQIYQLNSNPADILPTLEVTANLTGDLTTLQGRSVFVVIEDSDRIVQGGSLITQPAATGNRLGITFNTNNLSPGRYTGPLRVSVCLDQQCAQRLGGTPINVPYDITVLRRVSVGFASDVPTLNGASSVPVEQTYQLTLPEGNVGALSAQVTAFSTTGAAARINQGSPATVTLLFPAMAAGDYSGGVEIVATGTKPDGGAMLTKAFYNFTYRVR